MKISGLIYGRRTTQWIGGIEFTDETNGITGKFDFSKGSSFFNKKALPLDCFEGGIQSKGSMEDCKIQGSWLEFIRFNDKL